MSSTITNPAEAKAKRKLDIKASSIFSTKLTSEQEKKKRQQIELLTKKRKLLVGKPSLIPQIKSTIL